jgi:hypothetical protein
MTGSIDEVRISDTSPLAESVPAPRAGLGDNDRAARGTARATTAARVAQRAGAFEVTGWSFISLIVDQVIVTIRLETLLTAPFLSVANILTVNVPAVLNVWLTLNPLIPLMTWSTTPSPFQSIE